MKTTLLSLLAVSLLFPHTSFTQDIGAPKSLTPEELDRLLGLSTWVFVGKDFKSSNVCGYKIGLWSKEIGGQELEQICKVDIPDSYSGRSIRIVCGILEPQYVTSLQLTIDLSPIGSEEEFLPSVSTAFELTGKRISHYSKFPSSTVQEIGSSPVRLVHFLDTGEAILLTPILRVP